MKKLYFAATVLALSAVFIPAVFGQNYYPDIQDSPYKESIEYLSEEGVVQGYPDGTFQPERKLNRVELLKIILESTVDEIGDSANCFPDVKNQWFSKYVCYAKQQGIVEGYPSGVFRPGQLVNMAEGLKMGLESFPVNLPPREDAWYSHYVEFAHQNNLFSKFSYLPDRGMTRGEMAFLVHQLLLNKEGNRAFTGVRSNLSAGCGKTPPATKPTQSTVNGVQRSYITVIPPDYNQNQPKKLIFAFHGRTNPNTMVRTYYKVEEAAGNEAIMIYPAGLPTGTNSRGWSDPGDPADDLRDYALFDQLLEEFSNNYCIDLDEVYVVAHSLGAWFTNSLACFRGDVIRGVGTLGGGTSIGDCVGPVATMIWHNPKDRLSPFSQGLTARDQYIRQNQCGQQTVATAPQKGNCVEYQGCYEDAPLIWCPHNISTDWQGNYYPHTWPSITGPAIWEFFTELE